MTMDPREQRVLCLDGGDGPGCYHPVDWHVGSGTPAPSCDCCSWRKNELARPSPVRAPVPAGFPAEKWSSMNRAERRAAMKGQRRDR